MAEVVVLSALRTPVGSFGGSLRHFGAAELGGFAASAAIDAAGVRPEQIGVSVFGNARQAGGGPNPARQIGRRAGLPDTVPAFTINQACASGLKAIELGWQEIALERHDCALVGGAEAMSRIPYLLEDVRWGTRMGNRTVVDAMLRDGYMCPLSEMLMGETAELLADCFAISRQEQDAYAAASHERALAARTRCGEEIVPIAIQQNGAPRTFSCDEHPRSDSTIERLARLGPAFRQHGTVTAGNSSAIADGAAALVLAHADFARQIGRQPLARIRGFATTATDPRYMGVAPVEAVRQLLQRLDLRMNNFAAIELNEAFAAQVLACDRELSFPADRLNVNGGAIAIGHPTGCSGARIAVGVIHELRRRGGGLGLATLCASGGMGVAAVFEA